VTTLIMHMSRLDVKTGDVVKQGDVIGAVGGTGRATGPHLHWGMYWRGAYLDPQLLAGPMPKDGG
ncbi:MAG: M23 family metallopeptidase, partial [Nitratireductor sp.]